MSTFVSVSNISSIMNICLKLFILFQIISTNYAFGDHSFVQDTSFAMQCGFNIEGNDEDLEDAVIVVVDGFPFTGVTVLNEIDAIYEKKLEDEKIDPMSSLEKYVTFFEEAVNKLIDQQITINLADRINLNIEKELNLEIKEFKDKLPNTKFSDEELKVIIGRSIKQKKMMEYFISKVPKPTSEEMDKYFIKYKSQLSDEAYKKLKSDSKEYIHALKIKKEWNTLIKELRKSTDIKYLVTKDKWKDMLKNYKFE